MFRLIEENMGKSIVKASLSLKIKMIIGVVLLCFTVGLIAIFSVYSIAGSIIDREYSSNAEKISHAVAVSLDPEEVKELTDAVLEIYYDIGYENIVPSTEWGSDEWNEYMANYDSIKDMEIFHKIQDDFRKYQDIYDVDCIYITFYKPEVTNAVYIVDGAYGEDECPPGCVDAFDDGIWPEEENPIVSATITNEDVYGWKQY